jgi:hypothetical protein
MRSDALHPQLWKYLFYNKHRHAHNNKHRHTHSISVFVHTPCHTLLCGRTDGQTHKHSLAEWRHKRRGEREGVPYYLKKRAAPGAEGDREIERESARACASERASEKFINNQQLTEGR